MTIPEGRIQKITGIGFSNGRQQNCCGKKGNQLVFPG
jgi:hypothetical protein